MRGWLLAGLGLVSSLGCGGAEERQAAVPTCTLPNCDEAQLLGRADALLGTTEGGIVFARRSFAFGGDWSGVELWHLSLVDAAETRIGVGIHPATVRVATDGTVLYLEVAQLAEGARWDDLRGVLHRWDPRTGRDAVLLDDVRPGQYDSCGGNAWAWHGEGAAASCGTLAVYDGASGTSVDVASACDYGTVEQLALFSTGCSRVILAGSVWEQDYTGITAYSVESGEARRLGSRYGGGFLVDEDGYRLVAFFDTALARIDVSTGHPYPIDGDPREVVPLALGDNNDLLYLRTHNAGAPDLYWARGFGEPAALVAADVEMGDTAFWPERKWLAWIEEGQSVEGNRIRVVATQTGSLIEFAAPALAFVGERGGAPFARRREAFSRSGWIFFAAQREGGGTGLDAWQPQSGVHYRLGDSAPRLARVDHDEDRIGWIDETGALRLVDFPLDFEPLLVGGDVVDFRFVGDWLVWTDGSGMLHAVPLRTGWHR
ncbi:hypothetical protein [Vulgatibacter sp.]|uniref:hypothetical protein n=1 Tax=Vulgatibacter sp. TaxID=1971226 RepID=UPI0035698FBA